MRKIANTAELQTELERLLDYAGSHQPSRAKLASELRDLSMRVAIAREEDILHETKNLYLFKTSKGLEIRLNNGTHAVLVGKPKDVESGKRTMERLERYPDNLRAMYK